MDVMRWLIEEENPSARYLALRHLVGRPQDDPEVTAARAAIPGSPPARAMLEAQWPAGYWMHPDVGYSPRHKATAWQVIFLATLGAPLTSAIDRACTYLLEHARLPDGRFTAYAADMAGSGTPQGTFLCLNGSLVRALFDLDYVDSRREESLEALAGLLLAGGPRCESCDQAKAAGAPCIYGIIKALGAFGRVVEARRSSQVQAATRAGVALLTTEAGTAGESTPLLAGTYRSTAGPGPQEHRFGFPADHRTDLLEALEALAHVGAPPSPAVETALAIVRHKRGNDGTWLLEYMPENMWTDVGTIGRPNKWVTIRALQALELWSAF